MVSERYAVFDQLRVFLPPEEAEAAVAAMFARYGSLGAILAAPSSELAALPAVGPLVAMYTARMLPILEAFRARPLRDAPVFSSPELLVDYLLGPLTWARRETFRVMFLDAKNRLIADESMGEGTVNHVALYPREVIKRALSLDACSLVLVHNHPSGDPTPSRADVEMTQDVKRAAEVLDMRVLDHIIVGAGRLVSLAREGLL